MSPAEALQSRNQVLATPALVPKVFQGLSEYFPSNTAYFYSFPSGQDSSFFNGVPAWMEELVAARSLVCAGPKMRAVAFASSLDSLTWDIMTQRFGTQLISRDAAIGLSENITNDITGAERNTRIQESLRTVMGSKELVMAQPFTDPSVEHIYQIPPHVTIMLNDKANRGYYMPQKYIPQILASFTSGAAFHEYTDTLPFPSVIKVSSSSSGDGVRICMNEQELSAAKEQFKDMTGTIIIEQFIKSSHNICVQFGIPADPEKPIEMLGYNEQLTSENGGFLAGVVNPYKHIPGIQNIYDALQYEVLPRVRALGWYGVGGIDVLIIDENTFYFIDTNFRMTATFTFIYLQQTQRITKPVVSFAGSYRGSYDDFLSKIVPLGKNGASDQLMSVIALTQRNNLFRFNAGLFFDNRESLKQNVQTLLDHGVESASLSSLVASGFTV